MSKSDSGFFMLESLVSLSILALFIGVVFPFGMELLVVRKHTKTDVELNRFLYESAMFYDREDPKYSQYLSGDITAHSVETESSIHIYYEDEMVSSVDFISAEWTLSE